MKRATIFFALSAVLSMGSQHELTASQPPNVIIIMTDDQGNNLECLGNPWLKTPNINELAAESVYLSNFHQDMLCTPSRASLMTGRNAIRTGAWRTSRGRSMMRSGEITIAEVFRENGYRTGQFGKWHLGDTWPFRPQDQGFDEVVGHYCGGIGQISDHWGNDYFDDTYQHNGVPTQYEGYCTDVFFNETIRFIKEEKDRPFMIYLAPNVAHLPNRVEDKYSAPYLEMGIERGQAIYYGMISNLDENMGKLMKVLEEEGLKDNTIILFTTDDGPQVNGQQFNDEDRALAHGFNMGQRGGKGSSYEGGHRLFSYLSWPGGGIKTDYEIKDLTSVSDIFPTLLDLCEIGIPENLDLDGRSFRSGLYGSSVQGSEERTIVISKFNNDTRDTLTGNMCVMYRDWRLNHLGELYNVANDREQRHDLADASPEIMALMHRKYREWYKNTCGTIKEPVRFVLGDQRAPLIDLTTQDTYMPEGNSAFAQKHASNLNDKNGPWKIRITEAGKYTFILSRYPLYTRLPFSLNAHSEEVNFNTILAKIRIGGREAEKRINPTDHHVSFDLILEAGDVDLQTWLISSEGKQIPAYFVQVRHRDTF